MKTKTFRIIIILYALLVAVFSLLPSRDLPAVHIPHIDLVVHYLMYAGFGYLSALAFGNCPVKWRRNRYWLLLILVAFGYWMEFLQEILPGLQRSFEWSDVVADTFGAFTGIFVRLRSSYQSCRCRLSNNEKSFPEIGPLSATPGNLALITQNPSLIPIIARTFGWRQIPIARKELQLNCICTGKGLISLPHFSYGDIRYPGNWDRQQAIRALTDFIDHSMFSSVELRFPDPEGPQDSPKVVNILDLKHDPWPLFHTNLRRKIRKAQKNGFTVVNGGRELLDPFYQIYSHHIRSIGSATLPKKWFRNLTDHYKEGFCGIFLLLKEEKPVGAAFNLEYRGFYENCWLAVLKPYQRAYGSYAFSYEMILHARNSGATTYSFGRSTRGSGVHRFKQQWFTTDLPLVWLKIPAETVNIRKLTWLNSIWKTFPAPLRIPFDNYLAKWIY